LRGIAHTALKLSPRILGWWYFSIAAGFVLLAVNAALRGEPIALVALRILVALGFAALGYIELRTRVGKK